MIYDFRTKNFLLEKIWIYYETSISPFLYIFIEENVPRKPYYKKNFDEKWKSQTFFKISSRQNMHKFSESLD